MRAVLLALLALSAVSAPLAAAHPFTEQTIPDAARNGPAGTTEIIVYFSEPVDIDFSEMRVFDAEGNQIDNRDTRYHEGELSIVVGTPPLDDGIYTATTKVLSKVDGHLVPGAFIFGIGDAVVTAADAPAGPSELVFLPEAGARFPGLVGQTIVLGAVIASLAIWGARGVPAVRGQLDGLLPAHHGRFMSVTGAGLVLVFVSDILMMAVQTMRLGASPADVIGTYFGTVWLARMLITVALLGMWFAMDRKKALTTRNQLPMLAASLALISTTTLIGHGAATEQLAPIILDYVHNLVAAVWIGGIIYFAFALLPALSGLGGAGERAALAAIPRFSAAFILCIGAVIVTGPALMWFLESDVGLITESVFGRLIILKIAMASAMVGLGAVFQFKLQRAGERGLGSGKISVRRRLGRSLRADAALGVALLGVVALLTNGTLPAGEIQRAGAEETPYGFSTTEFTGGARFDVDIVPFAGGTNTITVRASDPGGGPLHDADGIKVKLSNPSRSISPIEVPMEAAAADGPAEYRGEITFGFSGRWLVEVEAQRTENPNESRMLDLLVKPRLSDIRMEVTEYELPEDSKPLYPLYDGEDTLWISDASAPRIWEFSLETGEFVPHGFDGVGTSFLARDGRGNIWFVDTARSQIGHLDPDTGDIATRTIPRLDPVISDNTPLSIQADRDGNVWIAVINKDRILRYSPQDDAFDEFQLPRGSLPFALAAGPDGRMWYTATGSGTVGYFDSAGNGPVEVPSDIQLQGPEALLFDGEGSLWISEHTGTAIVRHDLALGTFERIPVPDPESLPFGMAPDRYGNIWFAQHVTDSLGVHDPDNGNILEVPVPTEQSFVQFMAADGDGNVWFVEQQGNRLGTIGMTELPPPPQAPAAGPGGPRYSEVAAPLMAAGVVAVSLFYVRAIHDGRRLGRLTAPDG